MSAEETTIRFHTGGNSLTIELVFSDISMLRKREIAPDLSKKKLPVISANKSDTEFLICVYSTESVLWPLVYRGHNCQINDQNDFLITGLLARIIDRNHC